MVPSLQRGHEMRKVVLSMLLGLFITSQAFAYTPVPRRGSTTDIDATYKALGRPASVVGGGGYILIPTPAGYLTVEVL